MKDKPLLAILLTVVLALSAWTLKEVVSIGKEVAELRMQMKMHLADHPKQVAKRDLADTHNYSQEIHKMPVTR